MQSEVSPAQASQSYHCFLGIHHSVAQSSGEIIPNTQPSAASSQLFLRAHMKTHLAQHCTAF